MKSETKIKTDFIRRGQIYTRDQISAALGVSPVTVDKWCNQGLQRSQRGTRAYFYLGDDLIDFLFPHRKVSP